MNLLLIAVAFLGMFGSVDALAAAGGAPATSGAAGGVWVALGIVYLTRRRQIGGWLLLYYVGVYGTLLLTALFVALQWSTYTPGGWSNARLYVWYLLSQVPPLMVVVAVAVVATRLLYRRTEANVRILRNTMLALVVAHAATLTIDFVYFSANESIAFDVYDLFSSVLWFQYFRTSTRVQRVFIDHQWNYDLEHRQTKAPVLLSQKVPLSLPEKRYLLKRAALAAAITFVGLLVYLGTSLGDTKPDDGLLLVPSGYALLAAALGRYLPIGEKKRSALRSSASPTMPVGQADEQG